MVDGPSQEENSNPRVEGRIGGGVVQRDANVDHAVHDHVRESHGEEAAAEFQGLLDAIQQESGRVHLLDLPARDPRDLYCSFPILVQLEPHLISAT